MRSSDSDGSTEPAMCHIEGPARPGGFELEAHPGSRPLKFHCGHWRHSQVDVTVAMCRASRSRLQCAKSEPSRHALCICEACEVTVHVPLAVWHGCYRCAGC